MCMLNSHQVIIKIQNGKTTNILQVWGNNWMYHNLVLLSMKWVNKLKESRKAIHKGKIEFKRNYFIELRGCFSIGKLALP